MKPYRIEPTNGRPAFSFTGDLLASVSSWRKGSDHWTVIEAFKTVAGKWVIVTIGAVNPDIKYLEERRNVLVFETDEDMTRKVGTGRLAERLYRELNINEITVD